MDKKKYTIKEVRDNVKDYVSYLKEDLKLPVKKVYLFGSYAKGKERDWSDVDVCIISPKFKKIDALPYLFRSRREKDIRNSIEPVGYAMEDFVDESPLVWEIKNTGKEIVV